MGVAVVVADTTVIVVTWRKTYERLRITAHLGMNLKLSEILLRDGE